MLVYELPESRSFFSPSHNPVQGVVVGSSNQPPTATSRQDKHQLALAAIRCEVDKLDEAPKLSHKKRLDFKANIITREEVREQLGVWKEAVKRRDAAPWINLARPLTHRLQLHPNQASFSVDQYLRKDSPAFASRADVSLIHRICAMEAPEVRRFEFPDFNLIREGIKRFKYLWGTDAENEQYLPAVVAIQGAAAVCLQCFSLPRGIHHYYHRHGRWRSSASAPFTTNDPSSPPVIALLERLKLRVASSAPESRAAGAIVGATVGK
ncbi:hypothetical protein PG994_012003 [Apiospora phragmitis]|uniref:Uncharacterized protein n=1 Tax=Apiospora phragmitis TaxID=2905665 RepID=A0ABR1TUP2_9PEZI